MTFKELKETLDKYNEAQLAKNVVVWSTADKEFFDADFQEIMIASDELNDEDASYLVI